MNFGIKFLYGFGVEKVGECQLGYSILSFFIEVSLNHHKMNYICHPLNEFSFSENLVLSDKILDTAVKTTV